jgi:hypothetical protein
LGAAAGRRHRWPESGSSGRGSQRGGGSWRRQRWLPPESPGAMRGPFWFRVWVFVLKQEKDGFKNSERSKTEEGKLDFFFLFYLIVLHSTQIHLFLFIMINKGSNP